MPLPRLFSLFFFFTFFEVPLLSLLPHYVGPVSPSPPDPRAGGRLSNGLGPAPAPQKSFCSGRRGRVLPPPSLPLSPPLSIYSKSRLRMEGRSSGSGHSDVVPVFSRPVSKVWKESLRSSDGSEAFASPGRGKGRGRGRSPGPGAVASGGVGGVGGSSGSVAAAGGTPPAQLTAPERARMYHLQRRARQESASQSPERQQQARERARGGVAVAVRGRRVTLSLADALRLPSPLLRCSLYPSRPSVPFPSVSTNAD